MLVDIFFLSHKCSRNFQCKLVALLLLHHSWPCCKDEAMAQMQHGYTSPGHYRICSISHVAIINIRCSPRRKMSKKQEIEYRIWATEHRIWLKHTIASSIYYTAVNRNISICHKQHLKTTLSLRPFLISCLFFSIAHLFLVLGLHILLASSTIKDATVCLNNLFIFLS